MRDDLGELVERDTGEAEEAVVDREHDLADEVQAVAEEQVVGLVDAAGLGVVHRDEAEVDLADLDGLEDPSDRDGRA